MSNAILPTGTQFRPFAEIVPPLDEAARRSDAPRKKLRLGGSLSRIHVQAYVEGRQDGYDEGFAQGKEEGREAMIAEMRSHVSDFCQELDQQAEKFRAEVEEWYAASEQKLSELAAAIAAKVLAAELSENPERTLGIVREALAEVTHATRARIRLHPFDASAIRENKQLLLDAAPSLRKIEIVEDPLLTRGCVIESDGGVIDASVRTRLELAYDALRGAE